MKKNLKTILIILFVSAFGYLFGVFNTAVKDVSEEQMYGVISIQYPNSEARMTSIKQTPKSECQKWKDDYFEAMMNKCDQCTVLINECSAQYPAKYQGIFDKKQISTSYIYKPYRYPEVLITSGLPEGSYEQLCSIEKSNFDKTECIQ